MRSTTLLVPRRFPAATIRLVPRVAVLAGLGLSAACAPAARQPAPEVRPDPAPDTTSPADPGPRVVQPGAPGEASRAVEPGERDTARARPSQADVAFMRAMIVHHAQALEMAALVPDRTERQAMRLLAGRIEASQQAEIAMMRRWLERREVTVAGAVGADTVADRAHARHADMAAGMATAAELARLEAARGDAFDRLFLELMIRHHEGALAMVAELAERGGRDPEVYLFAGHVDADQRAEIARMRRLQEALSR